MHENRRNQCRLDGGNDQGHDNVSAVPELDVGRADLHDGQHQQRDEYADGLSDVFLEVIEMNLARWGSRALLCFRAHSRFLTASIEPGREISIPSPRNARTGRRLRRGW